MSINDDKRGETTMDFGLKFICKRISVALAFLVFLLSIADLSTADEKEAKKAKAVNDEELVKEGLAGSVTFGGAGTGVGPAKSFKFGEYSGITGNEGYFAGDADLRYNRGSYFLNLMAEDVGLENRRIFLESGSYGDYKVSVGYDEQPHLLSNTSGTPFFGASGTNLTLPSNFVKGNTTSAMTIPNLNSTDLEVKRKAENIKMMKSFGENTDFKVSFKREDKDGLRSLGGTVGTNGGNSRSILLPEILDQTTNEMSATLAHNGENAQVQLDYSLSVFDNNRESMIWQSPFSGANLASSGLISRPPDNKHWKVGLSGGMNFSESTRVSGVAEYGVMSQNETLFPFALGTSASLLPRSTADTEIDTVHVMLNATSNPAQNLGLNAKYRHYQTINKTPETLFLYMKNDTTTQAALNSDFALKSLPYDYSQDQINVDGSYHLFKGTSLKLGYGFELMERSFREISQTLENTVKGSVRSNYFSFAGLNMNASYARRTGLDAYDEFQAFAKRHTREFIDSQIAAGVSPAALFDNNPLLRRQDISDRDRMQTGASVNFFPLQDTTVGLAYNYRGDDYGNSYFGLNSMRTHSVTTDVTYSPSESATYYVFYTYENINMRQSSRSFTTTDFSNFGDPSRNWSANHEDAVNTIGIGSNLSFMRKRLTVNADYSYSESATDITFVAGNNSTVAAPKNMPDLKTRLHTFKALGKYRYTRNIDLGLRYLFEIYESNNFSTDGFTPGSSAINNVLTLSGATPDYNAHVGLAFVTYHFDARPLVELR